MVPGSQERSVSLNVCLLEGDSVAETRARRGKQRAILVSIVLQILIVTALLLIPLLGKSENIAGRVLVPTVPYPPAGRPHIVGDSRSVVTTHPIYDFSRPHVNSDRDLNRDFNTVGTPGEPEGPIVPGTPYRDGVLGSDSNLQGHVEPPPPLPTTPTTIRVSAPVQAAMLIQRIEPIYPPLARQMRREGRVELHAIIATDGSIQSLEVISGDPLLIQSALTAVREWRYRPTILNGQPVEVDTHITVIYTLAH